MFAGWERPAWRATAAGAWALACGLACAAGPLQSPADYVPVGQDGRGDWFIAWDSLRQGEGKAIYDLVARPRGGGDATTQRIMVECARHGRGQARQDAQDHREHALLEPVRAGSREALEIDTACALLPGPKARIFPALVVGDDGTALAALPRVAGCDELVAWTGERRRGVHVIAQEGDLALLRVEGGPWSPMPRRLHADLGDAVDLPATLLGYDGLAPRASATLVSSRGGWLQALTLHRTRVDSGIAWDADGAVIGFATLLASDDNHVAASRLVTADAIASALASHGLRWPAPFDRTRPTPDQAMREAVAATLPLACVAMARSR